MSQVFFISDLHLGHKNILKFSREYRVGDTIEEHNEWLIDSINSTVTPRDLLFLLGDLVFNKDDISYLKRIRSNLSIILGNHDHLPLETYTKLGKVYPGLVSYKGFWVSHAPLHPSELRGRKNIHGHTHSSVMLTESDTLDTRYINVCVEPLNGKPISLEEIRSRQ